MSAAAAAGYEAAGTAPRRLWPMEPLLWPRVQIGAADSYTTFQAKVSPRMRRLRATSVWPGIDAPRRILRDWALQAGVARRLRDAEVEGRAELLESRIHIAGGDLDDALRERLPRTEDAERAVEDGAWEDANADASTRP